MAKGRKSLPGLYATGKGIYPIIPYRGRFQRSTVEADLVGLGNAVIIDFDLQFEDNEVMDIIAVEWEQHLELEMESAAAVDSVFFASWLLENPELTTTDFLAVVDANNIYDNDGAVSDDQFVTNSSLIDYYENVFSVAYDDQGETDGRSAILSTSKRKYLELPQPYTVARNVLINGRASVDTDLSTHTLESFRVNCTIWGRRRKAPDNEFKNIIYRQRF